MKGRIFAFCAVVVVLSALCSGTLRAQTVCDIGNQPLQSVQPSGITPADIIAKFAAKETIFKAARDRYGYTLDMNIETLDVSSRVDGTYRQVSEIALDDFGKRIEKTTFAPQSTLRKISPSEDDLNDLRQPFMLPTEELPLFSVVYDGRQHVDKLDTYVFDVASKNPKKQPNLFEGRLWVDDQDLIVVKTCGHPRPHINAGSMKKNARAELTPMFVTYREEIDDQFWLPTYVRADEILSFPRQSVHVREVAKYSNYKPLASK